ncbi:hypothetical protein HYW76_04460 [Candidatus Pacearchaeota archaeon]|nr:hypothetical protein [Candidatus Pacearchaeota archaeon]
MGKKPTLAQMFKYSPEGINLAGFPSSRVFRELSLTLGQEVSLADFRNDRGKNRGLIPSFPLEYILDRQEFFERLQRKPSASRNLFFREFPREENAQGKRENFLDFCSQVYETLGAVKRELEELRYLSEARRALKDIRAFDRELKAVLETLKAVEESSTFALDSKSGLIVPIDKMPSEATCPHYKADYSPHTRYGGIERDMLFSGVRAEMKARVLEITGKFMNDFRDRIQRFVREEFHFSSGLDNLRKRLEQFALPVRLSKRYDSFLNWCEDVNYPDSDRYDDEDEEDMPGNVSRRENAPITFPQFGDHYDISNLFPPSLMGEGGTTYFVPIDFKTDSSEKKFLLAGLHSGGKSFFLENLVLTTLLAQVPLRMPSDKLILPSYRRIFYHRNAGNGGKWSGKLETELRKVGEMIRKSQAGDLVVLDEFLDSTTPEVATWLSKLLLNQMKASEATFFVSTHRAHNFRALRRQGWTILSPKYEIRQGKVAPTYKLGESIPDERINMRYIRERHRDILEY